VVVGLEKGDASSSAAVRSMLDSLEGMGRDLLGLNDSGLDLTVQVVDGQVGVTTKDPNLATDVDADLEDYLIDFSHEQDEPIEPQQLPASPPRRSYYSIPAILPTGPGAVGIPSGSSLHPSRNYNHPQTPADDLPHQRVFYLDSTLCHHDLPPHIAEQYSILVIRRGGCSFSEKLSRIPFHSRQTPSKMEGGESGRALELVVILSHASDPTHETLVRPLLDSKQVVADGQGRAGNKDGGVAMCLVDGSAQTAGILSRAAQGFGSWDGQGMFVERGDGADDADASSIGTSKGVGFAVRRRFWVESLGVRIANLVLL